MFAPILTLHEIMNKHWHLYVYTCKPHENEPFVFFPLIKIIKVVLFLSYKQVVSNLVVDD